MVVCAAVDTSDLQYNEDYDDKAPINMSLEDMGLSPLQLFDWDAPNVMRAVLSDDNQSIDDQETPIP